MSFLTAHAAEIWAIVSGVVTLAAAVAALTPTPKDDGIVAGVRKIVDLLAMNFGNAKNQR